MRSLVSGLAAAILAMGLSRVADRPATAGHTEARITEARNAAVSHAGAVARTLYFAGADLWQSGAALHGGLLWSPGGLERPGPALKFLSAAGTYRYRAGGAEGTDTRGTMGLVSLLAGWRFRRGAFTATVLVGPDLQVHRFSPHDPGNRLQGVHAGLRAEADIWYQPAERLMASASASVSTIGTGYWTRIAAGFRLPAGFWLGPELSALGGPTHQEARFGLHATGLRTKGLRTTGLRHGQSEWSVGAGYAAGNANRHGVYLRLGVLARR